MAKQNVTFVERHLEKIVVGVTGAVLLATAVLYLVSNPHSVEVQGERVGPQELYATIREQAETTLRQMRQAQPPDDSGGADLVIPDINNQRSPYDSENIPREFTIIFAPLSPEVPMIKGAQRGKIRLAEILPPGPIAATSGRAYAKLATPSDISQSGAPTQEPSTAVTQDWNWVAVFSAVHRRKQRAKFEQAQYAFDRQHVIVAGVEAERQERLPDGQWGEARIVTGYSDKVIPPRKTADLIRQDDGTVLVGDLAAIGEYRKLLDARENQVQILRPPFQSFIECPVLWQVPAELPGLSLKWEEFEAVVKSGEGKPARFRGAAAGMDKPRLQPVQLLNKAKEAIAKKEFLTAEELLLEVDSAESALPKQKEDAKSLLRSIQADLERVRAEAARKATIADTLGPEVEPLWLTDLTVTPGKAYRYRLRVLAFNPYVGYATQLENPNDAGRVLVEGAWSEWSDPVEVKPSSYLFFTAARPARIEMHDWTNGQWVIGARSDIKVGDPIAFTESRHDFAYDAAVVAGLNPQINYPERSVSGKDGQISYQERPTASMTLITADGEVEERIASVDLQRRKELRNENRDIDNLCKEFKGLEPVHAPLQERRPPGGPRGRPPAPGLEPGLERGLGQ